MEPMTVSPSAVSPPGGVVPEPADNGPQRHPLGLVSAASDTSATCQSSGEGNKTVVGCERYAAHNTSSGGNLVHSGGGVVLFRRICSSLRRDWFFMRVNSKSDEGRVPLFSRQVVSSPPIVQRPGVDMAVL